VNRDEAALVGGIDVYAVPSLADAVAVVLGHGAKFRRAGATVLDPGDRASSGDFADVKGQTVGIQSRLPPAPKSSCKKLSADS